MLLCCFHLRSIYGDHVFGRRGRSSPRDFLVSSREEKNRVFVHPSGPGWESHSWAHSLRFIGINFWRWQSAKIKIAFGSVFIGFSLAASQPFSMRETRRSSLTRAGCSAVRKLEAWLSGREAPIQHLLSRCLPLPLPSIWTVSQSFLSDVWVRRACSD